MHFEGEGILAVLGDTASITSLTFGHLQLARLSVVDELNTDAQLTLGMVLRCDLHTRTVLQLEPVEMHMLSFAVAGVDCVHAKEVGELAFGSHCPRVQYDMHFTQPLQWHHIIISNA